MGVPPCFAPGTLITTPDGPCAVEHLRVGDLVSTADHGPQPLRWIGRRCETFQSDEDKHLPIEIKASSLGDGMPWRDLVVSPQHRMVLSGTHVHEMFDAPEVLALAKALTGRDGIGRIEGREQITYFALLFERHEIIFAEGAATESFRPGPVTLAEFSPEHREQIYAIYPRLREEPVDGLGPPARPIITRRQARDVVALQMATPISISTASERKATLKAWDNDLQTEKQTWQAALDRGYLANSG